MASGWEGRSWDCDPSVSRGPEGVSKEEEEVGGGGAEEAFWALARDVCAFTTG